MMRVCKSTQANTSIAFVSAFIAGLTISTSYDPAYAEEPSADVLSIGGSVTEIIYALGQEHRLAARDTTSTYPPEALKLPNVGYIRALSPEGVLSVKPNLIISEEGAGPPEALEVLQASTIPFIEIPDGFDADTVSAKINAVGAALGVEEEADKLATKIYAQIDASVRRAAKHRDLSKRVMFILSTQGGRILAAGRETSADAIIRLSGAVNAVDSIKGYKPISDEAVGLAAPDLVIMMDRGGDHAASDAELWAMPAMKLTPAGQSKSLVRMNGLLLLGFGPRVAEAIETLNTAIYGAD